MNRRDLFKRLGAVGMVLASAGTLAQLPKASPTPSNVLPTFPSPWVTRLYGDGDFVGLTDAEFVRPVFETGQLEFRGLFNATRLSQINEAGFFDRRNGVLLATQTFRAINLSAGDSLQLTWHISLTQG